MSNIVQLPDQRLAKAVDDIVDRLMDFDPPIHTLTALGILEMAKIAIINEVTQVDED